MPKSFRYIIGCLIAVYGLLISANMLSAKVKGDPELLWLSPLGDEDIENNAYNRCRIIKMLKPGIGQTSTATKNSYDIFTNYISNLYAQAIKISAYIDQEDEGDDSMTADISNEIAIIEEGIIQTTADISRRINIINSFEAGISILDSLEALDDLSPGIYSEFRAMEDGHYEYVSDCEVLK